MPDKCSMHITAIEDGEVVRGGRRGREEGKGGGKGGGEGRGREEGREEGMWIGRRLTGKLFAAAELLG
eukprot:172178-Hanusia_phi.AAC.3